MYLILYLKAIFLGIIEGLTEFLPVSSTGHLIVLSDILEFNTIPNKTFEIIIQLGAILAVCFLYREKIYKWSQLPHINCRLPSYNDIINESNKTILFTKPKYFKNSNKNS